MVAPVKHGLYISNTIFDTCMILNEQTNADGGGVYFESSKILDLQIEIVITNSTFNKCNTSSNGGGLYLSYPKALTLNNPILRIFNSNFIQNEAANGGRSTNIVEKLNEKSTRIGQKKISKLWRTSLGSVCFLQVIK